MKKRQLLFMALTLVLLVVGLTAGCGSGNERKDSASGTAGTITIAGSTSVQPFSEVLAEEFMVKNSNAQINVQGGGSSQGIQAANSGVAQIGSSSRELKPEESGLKKYVIAMDGIAVIVNPSNNVQGLSIAQLKEIYIGKITNWSQVGGSNQSITVVNREAGSGTRDGFESMVMNKDAITDKALIGNSTGAVRTMVAGDKTAIGYVSMASLDQSVKAISVNGVMPSEESIKKGEYKMSRPFIYVTRGEPTGLAKTFIDFVLSPDGQAILKKEGVVPVK